VIEGSLRETTSLARQGAIFEDTAWIATHQWFRHAVTSVTACHERFEVAQLHPRARETVPWIAQTGVESSWRAWPVLHTGTTIG
jgi:2-oxo-4-hydroxy-4-carboxy--5-ureidoimidazoline (OHCU) decarboxylase